MSEVRLPTYKGKDMTGKKLGSLVVVKWAGTKFYGQIRASGSQKQYQEWEVICDCGNKFITNMCHIVREKKGCYKCYGKKTRGSNSVHWKGGKYVTGYFISKVKQKLERPSKTIEYDLSVEFIDSLYESQNKKCPLSGLPISFESVSTRTKEECSASLDRIDSSKGYTEDNVQLVHKIINIMKQDLSQVDFIKMCIDVANYQQGDSNGI